MSTALLVLGLVLLCLGVGVLLHAARDYAHDRAREARYADEWVAKHRAGRDRYLTADEESPL